MPISATGRKGLLTRFHGGAARAGSDLTDAENQEVVLEDRYQLASDPKSASPMPRQR